MITSRQPEETPAEQVAGNMDTQTALSIRHNFRASGYRVTATEYPRHYWTINAYPKTEANQAPRVINAHPEWRLSA